MSQQFKFEPSNACSEGCGGACVTVATNLAEQTGMVALRDSKTGVTSTFSRDEWTAFTDGVKAGQFDI